METKKYASIAEFYAGRSVFLTGGTGYVGKVFIESLLYNCRDINKIYVLVRPKNDATVEKRVQQFAETPLFARLKARRADDLAKIVPVVGDIASHNLGITPDDEEMLVNEVSVVFHSAAITKFNERITKAMEINVEGTRKVLDLCKRMKKIQAYVHISTAFSNTDQLVIDEVVYPPPMAIDDVYSFIDSYGDDEKKTTDLLHMTGRPNTYTFTKALAETLVLENHGDVPCVIIRPSVVIPTKQDPMEGWIDSWNGATRLLYAAGKGIFRFIYGEPECLAYVIPVDFVSNLAIVSAARCDSSEYIPVYNSCTAYTNPLKWHQFIALFIKEATKNQFNEAPFPFLIFIKNRFVVWILTYIFQMIPSYILDIWRYLRGKKLKYTKFQSLIATNRNLIQYFVSHSWIMKTTKYQALSATLSPEDRRTFPFDPREIDWTQYMPKYFHGIQKYLVGEKI